MNKTKLLLASPTFYPSYGGAEIRFRRYLPKLKTLGIEPEVFTGTAKSKKLSQQDRQSNWYKQPIGTLLPEEEYLGIRITRYRLPDKPASRRLKVFHEKLRLEIENNSIQPDVIQFLSPIPLSIDKTLKFLKEKGISTVFTYTLPKIISYSWLGAHLENKRLIRMLRGFDCIVVSSNEVKSYLELRGVKNDIKVIPNGVDTQKFAPAINEKERISLKKKLGLSNNRKYLLSVGTIHPRKGTDLLLKSFKILAGKTDDTDLYICGPRADLTDKKLAKFKEEINKLLSDPLLKDRVYLSGFVDNIEQYMRIADVFIFPSREEGMGNVVLEAMASKLPVVMTPFLGFPKYFGENGKHYLLSDFDELDIAHCVERLLKEKDLAMSITCSAYNNIIENHVIDKSIDKYFSLYQQLAN